MFNDFVKRFRVTISKEAAVAKVTIADIAKETGFSATTISRYLNGKYEFMSEATRQRIAEAIGKSEYKPNKMARSLRLQQSQMIGVLVSDITSPFSSFLFKGITEQCEKAGYTVLLADAGDNPETERKYIQSMLAQGVDGLIINATGADVAYLNEVNRLHAPIILADRPVNGFEGPLVMSDTNQSMADMLKFMKDKGYTDVCYVTGTVGTNGIRRNRTDAFKRYHHELWGHEGAVVEYGPADLAKMEQQVLVFVKGGPQRAVLAGNGIVLNDLAKLCRQHQLEIGKTVGLGAYDNWPWMDVIGPGITVMEVPTYDLGKHSAERLLQQIQSAEQGSQGVEQGPQGTEPAGAMSAGSAQNAEADASRVDILPCRLIVRQSL